MNTAPGSGEEDACSSVPARGLVADARTSRADRVGTDDNQSADACARSGSKNTHRHTDSLSESDFCIAVARNEENDVFPLLEADLDIQEKEGKPVAEKLAKVARSRFSVKLSENKLKEKLDSHLIPENCTEIRAPVLNVEIVEKGNLDRTARKNDARLLLLLLCCLMSSDVG